MSDDFALLQAWQAGDDGSGEALFRRHYPAVLRFFHNKVGAQAPDLVQRTFLGCHEARGRIREQKSFRPFLFGVARNVLYDHYHRADRDRAHLEFGEVSAEDLQPTPTSIIAEAREVKLLLDGLRRIPLEAQVILEMYYWEGMRAREIGEAMGMLENTVRTKIRRSRLLLEKVVKQLSASPELQRSTIAGIETWARDIREAIAKS